MRACAASTTPELELETCCNLYGWLMQVLVLKEEQIQMLEERQDLSAVSAVKVRGCDFKAC